MEVEDLVDLVGLRADDVVHTTCECTDYRWSLCGIDREGYPERPGPPTCPLCCDLAICPLCDS